MPKGASLTPQHLEKMAFLQFLLFIVLAMLLMGGIFAYRIFRQVRSATKHFRRPFEEQRDASRKQTTFADGSSITDTRTPEQANQKIIPQDEGEYVDYHEV